MTKYFKYTEQLERFFNHAHRNGLELLEGDKMWVARVTRGMPEYRVRELLMPYIDTWRMSMAHEPVEQRKQNTGRAAANTQLRQTIFGDEAIILNRE